MKKLRELLKLDVMENPDDLFRFFIATTVTSIIVILFLVGLVFHGFLNRYVLKDAENESVRIAKAVLAEEIDKIITTSRDSTVYIDVKSGDIPRLDKHLRKLLSAFEIVKIKIYTPDTKVVFSTDMKIIGELDPLNIRLNRALAGQYDSHVEKKEMVRDLADEQKLNVDVVESYIPITDKYNKVIGSFEVYVDVTEYSNQVHLAVVSSVCISAFTLFVVFGFAFFLVNKETKSVKKLQEILRIQAITDPLTGIFNKRQIILLIEIELSRLMRERKGVLSDSQLGCIMIDIDKFKQINDTYACREDLGVPENL